MVYQWKSGCRYGISAQAAGEQCEQLAKAGNLSAKSLVDVNRPEDAPLHPAFEWNDAAAAELYREEQARHIIRSIVTVKEQNEQETTVRAFLHIEANKEPEYKPINTILSNKSDTDALLKEAYRDAEAFLRKYQTLRKVANKELTAVFTAVDCMLAAGMSV